MRNRRSTATYSTIYRYVIGEGAFSFFVSFLFFFFIFFINQLLLMAEEILSKRAPPHQVALLILFSLPAIIAMAAPFASLVGILMAVGRMTSDNEILIIRASGFSYRVVFIPVLVLGAAISLLSFFANDVLLPAGTLEFGKFYKKLLLSTPAMELESNTVKRYKDTVIITGKVADRKISDLLIFDRTNEGERRIIVSGTAKLEEGKGDSLSLELGDTFIQSVKDSSRGDYDYAISKQLIYTILQKDLVQSIGTPGPREMSSTDVAVEIRKKKFLLATKTEEKKKNSFQSMKDLEGALRKGPEDSAWNTRSSTLAKIKKDINDILETLEDRNLRVYKLEYYKKFSIPFGALSFVFLATPLGLFARKSGQSLGFAVGLIIAVVYWALLIGGQTLGVRLGYSPFWAMWLPNIVAIIIGLILTAARLRR
ncbi:MAG: LptF/LptG family permease [Treponemataceae bacterium]